MRRIHRPLVVFRPPPYALDAFVVGGWSACYFARLLTGWSGACMRIRRSSDNAETDIGFANRFVASGAAVAFAGAGDAFLVTLYDQFGLGNHLTNSTASKQPRVVASGVWDGFARMDATNDFLVSTSTSGGANTAFTAFLRGTLRNTASVQMLVEHTVDTNSNDGADYYSNTGPITGFAVARNTSAQSVGATVAANNFDGSVSTLRCDVGEAAAADRVKIYKSGVYQANGSSVTGSPTGAFANASYYIGARGGVSLFASLNLLGVVIYQGSAGLPNARISAISDALAAA